MEFIKALEKKIKKNTNATDVQIIEIKTFIKMNDIEEMKENKKVIKVIFPRDEILEILDSTDIKYYKKCKIKDLRLTNVDFIKICTNLILLIKLVILKIKEIKKMTLPILINYTLFMFICKKITLDQIDKKYNKIILKKFKRIKIKDPINDSNIINYFNIKYFYKLLTIYIKYMIQLQINIKELISEHNTNISEHCTNILGHESIELIIYNKTIKLQEHLDVILLDIETILKQIK